MTDADPPQLLTPELVCRAGAAIYGADWQMPLARLLGKTDRTLRRIALAARTGEPYSVDQTWREPLIAALAKAARDLELRAMDAEAVRAILADQ